MVLYLMPVLASVLMVHNRNYSMLQSLHLLVLLLLNSNLSVLTVLDQTQPLASVLMIHNHKQQHHSIENRQKVKLMCSFSKKDEDRCILYKSTDHNKSYVPVIYFLT